MRLSSSIAWVALLLVSTAGALLECGSTDSGSVLPLLDGGDAGAFPGTDAFIDPDSLPPKTASCADNAGPCLSGTAEAGVFALPPTEIRAYLYGQFPVTNPDAAPPAALTTQKVALDGTWAFQQVAQGAHYFVEFAPGYPPEAGVTTNVATWVGPLAIPADADASIAVHVRPADLQVFEQGAVGGAMQVDGVFANLSEPTPGGSTVSVLLGGAPVAVPYDAKNGYYFLPLATPAASQATYQVTTQAGAAGTPVTWTLTANPPAGAGTITAPASGAQVPVGQPLLVSWTSAPEADFVLVQLFQQTAAGPPAQYAQRFVTAPADLATLTTSIPKEDLATAGAYVVQMAFTRANCPASADGCVRSSRVVTQAFTAQ